MLNKTLVVPTFKNLRTIKVNGKGKLKMIVFGWKGRTKHNVGEKIQEMSQKKRDVTINDIYQLSR